MLVDALAACDDRRRQLECDLDALRADQRLTPSEAATARRELTALAVEWRRILKDDPTHARPIVATLLADRMTFTPLAERGRWEIRGEGTMIGLFGGPNVPKGISSPTGFEPVFWP